MNDSFLPHWHCARIINPTSIVKLEYVTLPQALLKPEPTTSQAGPWTRVVLISDTHGKTFLVPDGDVLLHSEDLTRSGTLSDLRHMMAWLYALPRPIKIVIAGNRDFILNREWYDVNWAQTGRHRNEATWEDVHKKPPESVFELLTGPSAVAVNLVYLQDQSYKFRARPGGREWTVEVPTSAIQFAHSPTTKRAEKRLMGAFPSTDILLTQCLPHNILDVTNKADRAGCPALAARLSSLRPRLHVFGQIYEARGAYIHLWARGDGPSSPDSARTMSPHELIIEEGEQTVFVNAANYPSGPNVPREYGQVDAGGVRFQPVFVDLLD